MCLWRLPYVRLWTCQCRRVVCVFRRIDVWRSITRFLPHTLTTECCARATGYAMYISLRTDKMFFQRILGISEMHRRTFAIEAERRCPRVFHTTSLSAQMRCQHFLPFDDALFPTCPLIPIIGEQQDIKLAKCIHCGTISCLLQY